MLNSQITLSARNIPTYAATRVQTREPRQCMWEDLLISGRSLCGRFTGMEEAAKAENKAMRGGGTWRDPYANNQRGAGAMGITKQRVLDYLTPAHGWQSSAEISEAIGVSTGKVRNALYALVTEGQLITEVVSRGGGAGGGRKGIWKRKEGGE